MLCASCGAAQEGSLDRCSACGASPVLVGRYRLEAVLGNGATTTTYRGVRTDDGADVCVKELRLARVGSFEAEKLFRREAALLRQLSHPAIPAYVDDFVTGDGKTLALYLVQDFVAGHTLAEELAEHRYGEAEVLAIVEELCEVLAYLHGRSPPVIHRDLKPRNVMRRTADGRLALIDFGAARDTVREQGGSLTTNHFS